MKEKIIVIGIQYPNFKALENIEKECQYYNKLKS